MEKNYEIINKKEERGLDMLVGNVLPGVLVRGIVTAKMTTKIRMDQKGQFSVDLGYTASSDPPLPFSSSGGWLMDFGALGNDPVHVVLTLNQGQTVQWWLVDTHTCGNLQKVEDIVSFSQKKFC